MIVYAYYGFGKTTLCENNKFSPFIEIDEEFGQADDMHVLKQLSKHSMPPKNISTILQMVMKQTV